MANFLSFVMSGRGGHFNYSLQTQKKKTDNVRVMVTMRRVRATIVAVEEQRVLHFLSVRLWL
jgi:translation initiation factor 1 (eIF-1/SUI1)